LFFTIQKFDFLVYSQSGCCYSGVPVLSVISVDFDTEVFWRQLLGFTYFVKPKGCIRFQQFYSGVFVVVADFCLLGLYYFNNNLKIICELLVHFLVTV